MAISPIFNCHKIKFSKLDELNPLNGKKVRFFINLESVLKRILTQYVNNYLVARNDTLYTKKELLSNIINLAQHYRLYCAKQDIESEVYLYWNYPCGNFNNYKYNSSYKLYYSNKINRNIQADYVTNVIKDILPQLSVIVKYINQVYLITNGEVESSLFPYVITKANPCDCQNIIISTDKYDCQYVLKDFDILIPNKDDSKLVTKNNVIDYLKEVTNVTTSDTIPINYVPFALSLLGDKYRNIQKIKGIGLSAIIKVINKGLSGLILTENTSSIEMLSIIIKEDSKELFCNNYHCTSLDYQYDDITENQIYDITSKIIDKFDDYAIVYMNDRYFKDHLLMLVETRQDQLSR